MNPQAALAALLAQPIAHRGLHGCGRTAPVENSCGAAEAAIAAGFAIECDVQLAADGEAVVFHDASLERLTAERGAVIATPLGRLSTIALAGSGETIPTLAVFLAQIAARAPVVVEIKAQAPGDVRLAARTLDVVRRAAGPVALESFDPAVVAFLRAKGAPCPLGLVGPPEDGGEADAAALEVCDFVSWSIDHVATIAARRPDLPRSTWTVRTRAQRDVALAAGAQIVFEGFDPATPR